MSKKETSRGPGSRKTLCLSTTTNWNPGDDWIRGGVMNVLNKALQNATGNTLKPNVVYYDRSPDLMIGHTMSSELRDDIQGNSVKTLPQGMFDLAVACGTPEWSGAPHKALHESVYTQNLAYILVGVGTTCKSIRLNELDKQVLSRDRTWIYTRSLEAADSINEALGFKKAVALPCPASLVYLGQTIKMYDKVQVPQGISGHHKVQPEILKGLDKNVPVITERIEEFYLYKSKGYEVEFSPSPADLLTRIGRYKNVYTTRLHGAIAAMSTGSNAVIVNKGDFRIETAAKMFDIPVVGSYDEAYKTEPKGLSEDLKWNTYNTYVEDLTKILEEAFNG